MLKSKDMLDETSHRPPFRKPVIPAVVVASIFLSLSFMAGMLFLKQSRDARETCSDFY